MKVTNPWIIFLAGLLSGGLAIVPISPHLHLSTTDISVQSGVEKRTLKYPLKATLYRLNINPQNKKVFDQWVRWHQLDKGPIAATMEREKMYTEAVFRDTLNDPNVIYWLAFEGTGGATYTTSNLPADKKHAAYMKQILLKNGRVTLKTDFLMLPPFLEKSISDHQDKP